MPRPAENPDELQELAAELPRIERYTFSRVLGEGAFGVVVLADDRELKRQVAIKFVHPDRRRAVELLQEARTLALMEHPGLCRVFDVGQAGGRTYIAMQYLEGETLEQAGPKLLAQEGPQEIARIVAVIADAAWFAHARGIAHRDIKASNVILTRDAAGTLQPVLLDFGLASPLESQASAVPSDIWALGEMLYVLLGGPPSGAGPSSLAEKPDPNERPSLLTLGKQVPSELDAVVSKATTLHPEQRYDSARALADDLRCVLEHRPPLAMPVNWLGRSKLLVRRNPVGTALALGAIFLIVAGGGAFLQQRRTASQRVLYTQRFTREAEQMESLLYRAFAMPGGESAAVLAQVRQHLADLQRETASLPPSSRGPLAYALGRVEFTLGDIPGARKELDRAGDFGFEGPELDHARGMASARFFLQEMDGVDGKARAARRKKLETEFPGLETNARRWLQSGQQLSLSTSDLGAALLAATDDRWDEAMELARKAAKAHPYDWEPLLFEGWMHRRAARALLDEGRWADLDVRLATWENIVVRAEDLGRSAPAVRMERLNIEMTRSQAATLKGDFSEERFQKLRTYAESVLALDPQEWRALISLSDLEDSWGALARGKDQDPGFHPLQSVAYADRACAAHPEVSRCWTSLGDALDNLARATQTPDRDKVPLWKRSIEAYDKALALRPNSLSALNNLGSTCNTLGSHLVDHGQDPLEPLKKGERAFRKALTLDALPLLDSNLALNLAWQAIHASRSGGDVERLFAEARTTIEAAWVSHPDHPNLFFTGGSLYKAEAQWRMLGHGDPLPASKKARELFELGKARMPENCEFVSQPLIILSNECAWRMRTGQNPESSIQDLERAWSAYSRRTDCTEWRLAVRVSVAIVRLLQARKQGTWLESEWKEAEVALQAWEKLMPGSSELQLFKARLAHVASGCEKLPEARRKQLQALQETSLTRLLAINSAMKEEAQVLRQE